MGDHRPMESGDPSAVTMPSGVVFTESDAGGNQTCALDAAGKAYCWGKDDHGQLGNGSNDNANTPQAIVSDVCQ